MQEPFSKLLLFSACSEPSTSTFLWKSITPIPYFPPLSCLSCPLSPHDVCQRVVRSECQQVQMFKFNLRVPPPPRICSSQFQRTKQSDKNIRKCVTILSPPPPEKEIRDSICPSIVKSGFDSIFYIYFSTNAIVGVSSFDLKGSTHHWFYANCSNLL